MVDRRAVGIVWRLMSSVGGRYSAELGIDVDVGGPEIERWFLASTLFGTRISAAIAERTFHVLDDAGFVRIAQARHIPFDDLVGLLDRGGYGHYDYRTATRFQELSSVVDERYGGDIAGIGSRFVTYPALREALDALPGWGPMTVGLFLRELRGVWPGAAPPLDERAARAACQLGLLQTRNLNEALCRMEVLARTGRVDLRDLESALVRFRLCHHGPTDTSHVVLRSSALPSVLARSA